MKNEIEKYTTDEILEELYSRILPPNQESLPVPVIMSAVASAFGVTVSEMIGTGVGAKKAEFSHPRTCSMALCYSLSFWNQVEIGKEHRRDPNTVATARIRIKELLKLPEVVRSVREALRVVNQERISRREEVPA